MTFAPVQLPKMYSGGGGGDGFGGGGGGGEGRGGGGKTQKEASPSLPRYQQCGGGGELRNVKIYYCFFSSLN